MSSVRQSELLTQATELLSGELDLLSRRRWEGLLDLKRRKVALAAEFLRQPWPVGAGAVLADLELRTGTAMRRVMRQTALRIHALQELQLYCMECDSISLRARAEPRP